MAGFAQCHVSVALSQREFRQAASSLVVLIEFDDNSWKLFQRKDDLLAIEPGNCQYICGCCVEK